MGKMQNISSKEHLFANIKSAVHFRWPEPENLNNLEKTKFSRLSEISSVGQQKWIPNFDFTGKKKLNSSHLINRHIKAAGISSHPTSLKLEMYRIYRYIGTGMAASVNIG